MHAIFILVSYIYLCYICVCILVLIWYNSTLYKLIIFCRYTFKHRFLILVASCIFTTVSCNCMQFLSRFYVYKYIYVCYICICILVSIWYNNTLYKLIIFYFNRDFYILVASCFCTTVSCRCMHFLSGFMSIIVIDVYVY
jgi:hypothetical protein